MVEKLPPKSAVVVIGIDRKRQHLRLIRHDPQQQKAVFVVNYQNRRVIEQTGEIRDRPGGGN